MYVFPINVGYTSNLIKHIEEKRNPLSRVVFNPAFVKRKLGL